MFKNDEYSSFLNIFIFLVLKQYEFASFVFLFRPLGYPIKPRPIVKACVGKGWMRAKPGLPVEATEVETWVETTELYYIWRKHANLFSVKQLKPKTWRIFVEFDVILRHFYGNG